MCKLKVTNHVNFNIKTLLEYLGQIPNIYIWDNKSLGLLCKSK